MKPQLQLLLAVPFTSFACVMCACANGSSGFVYDDAGLAPPDDAPGTAPPDDATVSTGEDGGSFPGATLDDASAWTITDDAPDDSATGPQFDAGDAGICTAPLRPGDLIIVELMIESTPGTGDHGEWIEVMSTLGCAVDLEGLQGECPTGAKVSTFSIDSALWIPPMGTFLVADSSDPAVNHGLPGSLVAWAGEPGDVLRNEGATVTLLLGNTIIDSVTYPTLKLTAGTSTAFPSDCAASARSVWTSWQPSTSSWFPAFRGTPNAPNTDVRCPTEADD